MWKDLTLKQKAEIMKMSVANGVTDINDIQSLYDNSIPNQFDDGGFMNFYNSLPRNQRDSTNYNVRRYWELNGRPKDFNEAVQRGMYTKQSDGWHANSVAYNEAKDEYEFMKSPTHPTTIYEIGAYLNNKDFQKEYYLDYTSKPNYKYRRKPSWMYNNGGHLYKNAGQLDKAKNQPKYQYGIIEQILRENGVNFRVTSGARKPNQAGNAGKSSAHTYTIFGGSPGAIDIVPGVGSDWNTLFAQMSSPKVKKALATYGLDILNETNPSVMASTKATGPHLHVGRGIKGQQGLGQIFGGTSYGGGRDDAYRLQYPSQRNSDYTPMYSQNAFEPIVIGGNNTSNPWLDYIRNVESIGNQGINPVSNTPIRPTNIGLNGIKSTFTPTDFSSLYNPSDVVSPLEPYAAKQNIEYGLGLEGNALWNSPYLMFDNRSAANGGHLFDTAGQMLIRDNAVNHALRYVYGDDYEEYVRQLRNYRPANTERRVKPRYNLSQQTDVIGNTTRPVNKSIRNKQINSPQRQQREQKLANDRYWQNERERQGTISQARDIVRDPVYNREFANEVQALREREAEEAKKRYPVDLAMKQGLEFAGEAMRPLFITSDIGALFDPNTRSVGDFFANIWSPNNKGIFNINQGLRNWYDANPELAEGVNLGIDLFGPGILGKAAKGIGKIPEVSRNLVASTALNYGAKTRTLPTNIYKFRKALKGPEGELIWDSDPFVNFIDSKREIPSNTSYFFRMPNDINILKARNGAYRAKGNDYVIHSGGTVDGKFVSYGEPWMEFGTGQNSAWYEFPTMRHRGPHRMATDWRGNIMDYTTQEAYDQMSIRRNPKFKEAENEFIFKDFDSREEALQARKDFNETWGIDPSVNVYDIYHSNQTVIPNKEWNFNSEYPRGFLSQPFWRYTQDPYSGAVQKELMMNWESPMKALDKTHADIIPFIDSETGTWDYLTDFKVSNDAQLDVDGILSNLDKIYKKFEESQEKLKAGQHGALRKAEEKVFDYLGSEKHVQRIMESGVPREQAEAIARDMRSNTMATKGNIGYTITPDAIGEYNAKWEPSHKGRFRSVFGNNKPSFAPEYTTSPVSPEDIYNNVLHELGGHGATMGYSPTRYINDFDDKALGLKAQAMYELDMERWSPHYKEVYENNSKLKPVRKAEYKDSKDSHIEYLEGVDEYSARARAYNIDPSVDREDVAELYKYFTKESVDKLLKGVWSLLPAGIGLGVTKSKSK